ncbi:unnamed protein product [Moneuplotes crassus]|uniref:Uncharacterized protein n=1 Tax=Euplotes crassus TaxID=5936 RepID=A0AAD1XAN7_EUPCR|nr:unnamed protein product [Moneuplotes crassus]
MNLNQDLHSDSLNDSRISLCANNHSPAIKAGKRYKRLKSQHGTPLHKNKKFGGRSYHNSFKKPAPAPCSRSQRPRTANYRSRQKRHERTGFNAYDFTATDPDKIIKEYKNISVTTPQMEYSYYEGRQTMNSRRKEHKTRLNKISKRFNEIEAPSNKSNKSSSNNLKVSTKQTALERMERSLCRPKSSYISSQKVKKQNQKLLSGINSRKSSVAKRRKRKITKSHLLFNKQFSMNTGEITNLKHFVNVLTNQRKGAQYEVDHKKNTRSMVNDGWENQENMDHINKMIYPQHYMRPLLRKRNVGIAGSEWNDNHVISSNTSSAHKEVKARHYRSHIPSKNDFISYFSPNLQGQSHPEKDCVKDLSHSFQYPPTDFKFEMKITKNHNRNGALGKSRTGHLYKKA